MPTLNEITRALIVAVSRMKPPAVNPEQEAERIIAKLGLRHPMTLSAAMKVVSSETPYGRLAEIEAVARALQARLATPMSGREG